MTPDLDSLAASEYLLLTTFRKDGRAVPTPVWVARDGDRLVAWTVRDSGKVKRIHRSPAVTVGSCNFRGRPRGESVSATARVLDDAETARVRAMLAQKYGIKGRLAMLGSTVRRGKYGSVGVAITLG